MASADKGVCLTYAVEGKSGCTGYATDPDCPFAPPAADAGVETQFDDVVGVFCGP